MGWLRDHEPGCHETADRLFRSSECFGNLYFPCNMFIAKRGAINAYCQWLFPILEAVAQNGGEKKDPYENRYVGTISERLLTLFFFHNRGEYRLALADKQFFS
jgi:hypothetical protein